MCGIGRQAFNRGAGVILQRRLQHQVFGGIAGDEQLGKKNKVGIAHLLTRGAGARQIAGDVAHHGVELRQRNARAAVAKLSTTMSAHAVPDERLVEILSPEATAQMFAQMHRTAQVEMISLTRRPMLISNINETDHLLFQCLERGVSCRALIDADLLAMPGWLEHMRDNTAHGEECRIASSLPFKLIVADRRIAIIPLNLERPDGPVLLVRSSSLLEALCEVFDLLWRNATPFPSSDAGQAGRRPCASLLSLLTSGLNDKAIELELDMSHRTLARRISELMKRFGATTRCQLGWLAAQRATGTTIK